MDVTDLVIVLVGPCSDLGSGDKDVSKNTGFVVSLDAGDELLEIFIALNVESTVPLSVFDRGSNETDSFIGHGKLKSEKAKRNMNCVPDKKPAREKKI